MTPILPLPGKRALVRRSRALAPAVLSGVLYALAFPPFELGSTAWIALVPLLVVLARTEPIEGALLGFVFGLVAFGLILWWILAMLSHHAGLPVVVCILPWMLLIGYLSLFPALFGRLLAGLNPRYGGDAPDAPRRSTAALRRIGSTAILWTGLEWIRGTALSGFPWALLGASQSGTILTAQSASLAGVYGLSFLVVLIAASVALLVARGFRSSEGFVAMAVVAIVTGLVGGWGTFRLEGGTPGTGALRIAAIQGNFDPDPSYEEGNAILATYSDMTRQATHEGAQLVLWPESCVPFAYEIDGKYRERLSDLVRETGVPLILGSVGGHSGGPYANSAFLVRPGLPAGADPRYDKRHLVPYGEYVPFSRLTPFVKRFVDAIGEFQAGVSPVVWDVAGVRTAPLICYEGIFADISRDAVDSGAELLVNLTNDGWFGKTPGPAQHLALARLRAIETARPFVRAANTGISAAFDARGRDVGMTHLDERTVLSVSVTPGRESTPATALGEGVPKACAILALVFAFLSFRRKRGGSRVTHAPAR